MLLPERMPDYFRISAGLDPMHLQNLNRMCLKMRFAKTPPLRQLCFAAILVFCFFMATPIAAQTQSVPQLPSANPSTFLEKRASLNLQAAKSNPLALRHFLLGMPKGADLHNHLSGAVYAESFIRAAVGDHLCIDPQLRSFTQPEPSTSACATGQLPAAEAIRNQALYDSLVDAFSMRGFVPSPGITGHDQFFSTFQRFNEAEHDHGGEWVDEVATRAATQHEQYLELMHTPSYKQSAAIARELGWRDDLASLRSDILKRGIADDISHAKAELDQADQVRRQREHCSPAGSTSIASPESTASPACQVEVRFLCQVLRGFSKEVVFAQTLFCFELATVDPRYVGINFVMPEDGYTSMTDYALHMRMVQFLHDLYPKVHISLHAGELAPGLVPYEGLCCHIRQAVEQAHAERIGHGVDIMYEERPHELLREMAAKHVMVEINLTSNDVILGIAGKDHPLPIYRQFHVPVALSTDDEGVSRIDLTHEYVRAVEAYGLTYTDLKQMVRTGMEHTFLPGESLWASPDDFTRAAAPCAHQSQGADTPSGACKVFLDANEKARNQWQLERRFRLFESSL
jgi:adenosine deaminase